MLQASDNGDLRSLNKLFLGSVSVNTGFKTPLNGIDHPLLVDLEKVEGRKKYLF